MDDLTGRYILKYQPSNSKHEYLQTSIEMSISDEATVHDMVNFFDSFLKASGYVYDGSLKVVKEQPEIKDTVITGSAGTDTIYFGSARPAMNFGFGSNVNDVISLG